MLNNENILNVSSRCIQPLVNALLASSRFSKVTTIGRREAKFESESGTPFPRDIYRERNL